MRTYDTWFKGGPDFSLLQQGPVYLFEEGVQFDGVLQPVSQHAAQPLGGTLGHELDTHAERPQKNKGKTIEELHKRIP